MNDSNVRTGQFRVHFSSSNTRRDEGDTTKIDPEAGGNFEDLVGKQKQALPKALIGHLTLVNEAISQ